MKTAPPNEVLAEQIKNDLQINHLLKYHWILKKCINIFETIFVMKKGQIPHLK